jgi:P-type conjugative transfer protein TrbJ
MTCSSRFRSRSRPARIAALLVVITLFTPSTTHAQFSAVVFDPTNFARNVMHYTARLQQMSMQVQQLQQQVVAMQKLSNPSWRQINATLAQADALMQQGQSLAYGLSQIDAEFQRTFPGVQAFQNYLAEEKTQATRTLATMRGALNAVNRASQDFPTSVARLQAMKQQLGTIAGHQQALELNGTIGMFGAEELTMLRQAVSTLTNVQAVYYADQVNAEAQRRATFRARLAAMSAPGPTYTPMTLTVTP